MLQFKSIIISKTFSDTKFLKNIRSLHVNQFKRPLLANILSLFKLCNIFLLTNIAVYHISLKGELSIRTPSPPLGIQCI